RCALFAMKAAQVALTPRDGAKILAHGYVELYPRDGRCQLMVDDLRPAGAGDAYLRLEALKRRLTAEGLFALERKRPLPPSPRRVADVTLADLVADIRAPTPSAAAALVVPDSGAAQQRAERAWRRVTARVHERIEERRRRLETARRLVDRRAPPMRLAVWRQRLDEA